MSLITFIVSPPQDPNLIAILSSLDLYFPIKNVTPLLCIQEAGKNGTHIHWNFIVSTTKSTDNLRKALYVRYAKQIAREIFTGMNFLVIKNVTNLQSLLSYYTKEPDYKVILNDGNYDLQNVKKWVVKTEVTKIFTKSIYVTQLVEAVIQYIEERQLDFFKVYSNAAYEDMEKGEKLEGERMLKHLQADGYNVISHWSKARALYCLVHSYYCDKKQK